MKTLLPILLLIAASGCGNPTKVSSGPNAPETVTQTLNTRRVTVDQTKKFGGLEITVGEIALESGKITVGITLKNTTPDKLTCYPDQGGLVIGKTQFDANGFMTGGDLSGDIFAGVEKRGSLAFLDKSGTIDPMTVTTLDLNLGSVYDKNFKAVDIHFPVTLK